jgi:hypothetical protein
MPSGKGSSGLPGADFAASVVGGAQTFSQKVIGNVGDFTSRVTNVTNPLPKASQRSHRRSHGRRQRRTFLRLRLCLRRLCLRLCGWRKIAIISQRSAFTGKS